MTGFHDKMGRIGPIAVIDLVGTIVIVILVGLWYGLSWARIGWWVVAALIIGEVVHLALKIDTPITQLLKF